jgi:hypothetical protein
MKAKLLTMTLLLSPIASNGMDGNGFMSICNPSKPDSDYEYACQGYVQATIDLIYSAKEAINKLPQDVINSVPKSARYCVPQIETKQAKLIAIKWYQNHPERLHLLAIDELRNSIYAAFPCGEGKD